MYLPPFYSLPHSPSSLANHAAVANGLHNSANNHNHRNCELNTDSVVDVLLRRMREHLPLEKVDVQNGTMQKAIHFGWITCFLSPSGAILIYDARISRFNDIVRLGTSCSRKQDSLGMRVLIPFRAEIQRAHATAKLNYNFFVSDIRGDYKANFSHIRMNGTFDANLVEETMSVLDFKITSSAVVSDSIEFGYVPRWILDWVRSYFDNDNTEMYQKLAKVILQKEVSSFREYDMLRDIVTQSMPQSPPLNAQDEDDEEYRDVDPDAFPYLRQPWSKDFTKKTETEPTTKRNWNKVERAIQHPYISNKSSFVCPSQLSSQKQVEYLTEM